MGLHVHGGRAVVVHTGTLSRPGRNLFPAMSLQLTGDPVRNLESVRIAGMSSWSYWLKNPPTKVGDIKGAGLILELGRFPGGGHGNPLQYSCLENPMDRRAWQATVHKVKKSRSWLKQLSMHAPLGARGTSGKKAKADLPVGHLLCVKLGSSHHKVGLLCSWCFPDALTGCMEAEWYVYQNNTGNLLKCGSVTSLFTPKFESHLRLTVFF